MASEGKTTIESCVTFGPFRLFLEKRVLLEGDKPVHLGSRALEILTALAGRPGELITKEELFARVWPNTFVEAGNLRVHIAALRRALDDGQGGNQYISTVPGRGYRFIASAIAKDRLELSAQQISEDRIESNLPPPLARMVGRDDFVATIVEQIPQRRFITIAGPGGIGKTTVALAVADKLAPAYRDGVRFLDLAPIADPQLVISTLASLLGLAGRLSIPSSGLTAYLRDKQMLLLFDNCDHVIETAAITAEEIYRHAPHVHILATSREPLRVEGERVQRLLPLGVPNTTAKITAKEALTFSAIQLFVERMAAISDDFELNDSDAPQVAEICRRLDGIALAIELAVGSVDTLGINGLAARLDDRFSILTRGRRTALPRHQTLRAVLDWSYEILPDAERVVLRRLAVFAGPFILNAAQAVAAPNVDTGTFADLLANLVAKSLLSVDGRGATVRYRLPDTTRAYGLDKLKEAGELEACARRHAEYYRDLFERAENEWDTRSTADLLADYAPRIDNVRAALDWAFSPDGDSEVGIALTIAAVPLWRLLSLMDECRSRSRRALIGHGPLARPSERDTMKLLSALGAALRYDKDPMHEIETAWTEALAMAEGVSNVDYQLRAISGLRNVRLSEGNLRAALNLARKFKDVASQSTDPTDVFVGDRMIGYGLHFLGDQDGAQQHIDNALEHIPPGHRSHIIRFGYDQRVLADNILAESLWLRGFPDQAMRIVERNVVYAQSLNHELSLCNAFGQSACPVALFTGDLAAAERYVTMLLEHSTKRALPLWSATGRCFQAVLRIKSGESGGLNALRSGLSELVETRFATRYVAFLVELADALCEAGENAAGYSAIEEALNLCQRNEETWCIAEALRIKAKLVIRENKSETAESAERILRESLEWSARQGALSWQLRAAISLARLQHRRGEIPAARQTLEPVYMRFTEGFGSADLIAANSLLQKFT